MKQLNTTISVGLDAPLTLLHISDTHLTLCDERDNERKRALAASRAPAFPRALTDLAEVMAMRDETGGLIVHTGDLIDFTSEANFDRARAFARESGCFFAAGNHEFSQYVGEAWEDADYRNMSLARVQACFANDIRFSSRVLGGVNLVAVDDSYYLFEPWQLERLKAEAEKGLPMILLMHTPLYEPSIFDFVKSYSVYGYVAGAPDEAMADYTGHRFRQQRADDPTRETIAWIKSQPLIKAILTGHIHKAYESYLTPTLPQYAVSMGEVRVVTVK